MLCESLILGLHLASIHAPAYAYQENFNPGIYAECDGWTGGVYSNTLGRASLYAGYTFHRSIFGLSLGAVSGYQRQGNYGITKTYLAPMLSPHITFGPVRVWYIPKTTSTNSHTFHLSVQREL